MWLVNHRQWRFTALVFNRLDIAFLLAPEPFPVLAALLSSLLWALFS
jgi:hypothetical protein